VTGAAIAGLGFVTDRTEELIGGDLSNVEVRQVVVGNGRVEARLVDGALRQTRDTTPQLDITVRNRGEEPVLLTKARIEIEDSAKLTVCEFQTGGEVPLAGEYAVELPTVPLPAERVVVKPLHQEVPAGGTDRVKLWFRVPRIGETQMVYALRVSLETDEPGEELEVGSFVLGVPDPIIAAASGRLLPVAPSFNGDLDYTYRLQSAWCYRHNLGELRRVIGRQGRRSREMAALSDLRVSPLWAAYAEGPPPAAAVEQLLDSSSVLGPFPVLAVFAAERSGDPSLVAQTRKRAAAVLTEGVEHAIDLGYAWAIRGAIEDLHQSLIWSPTVEARELLELAEARLPAAEAQEDQALGGE
jgi:hypothetical protein